MSESFSVSSRLTLSSNVNEVLRQLISSFEDLDKLVKNAQEGVSRFAKELTELGRSNSGIGKLVAEIGKLSNLKLGSSFLTDLGKAEKLSASISTNLKDGVLTAATEWKRVLELSQQVKPPVPLTPAPQPAPAQPKPRRQHGFQETFSREALPASIGLQMGGEKGLGFFEQGFHAYLGVDQQLQPLRHNTTLSDADRQAALETAKRLVREVPGTTVEENARTIVDAYTVTGNLQAAVQAAKSLAETQVTLEMIPGKHYGDQAFAAAQSIELLQRFYDKKTGQIDISELNREVQEEARVAIATGGRVTPEMYRGMARRARASGMALDDQALFEDMPAMMIALGGDKAGTALAAGYRQLISGTMTQAAETNLERLGFLDKTTKWAHGRVQDMAKHFKGFDLYMKNPIEWVREVGLPILAAHGIDAKNRSAVQQALTSFASTNVGLGWLSEMFIGMEGINKEAEKIRQTDRDPKTGKPINPYDVVQQSPALKLKEFYAAQNELLVTVGGLLMGDGAKGLRQLTDALRGLSDWLKANPDLGKQISEIGAGFSLAAVGIGKLAMELALLIPIVKILRSVGAGSAGGAAAGAALGAAERQAARTAAGTLVGAATGAGGLGVAAILATPGDTGPNSGRLSDVDAEKVREEARRKGIKTPGEAISDWWNSLLSGPAAPQKDFKRHMGGLRTTDQPIPSVTVHPQAQGSNKASVLYTGDAPLKVEIVNKPTVNVGNGHALVSGVGSGLSDLMNRPDKGVWGPDISSSFAGAQYGR